VLLHFIKRTAGCTSKTILRKNTKVVQPDESSRIRLTPSPNGWDHLSQPTLLGNIEPIQAQRVLNPHVIHYRKAGGACTPV
jgi:hypothetical protein